MAYLSKLFALEGGGGLQTRQIKSHCSGVPTLLPNQAAVSTKYINNFHTSKYSERTESLARAKSARYQVAKFVASRQYRLFDHINLLRM